MNLSNFNTENLFDAASGLFTSLGINLNSNTRSSLSIDNVLKVNRGTAAIFDNVAEVYFLGIVDDSVLGSSGADGAEHTFESGIDIAGVKYDGLMVFAVDLTQKPTRTDLSTLTRAFNRISKAMPVALLAKYRVDDEVVVSLAISERFKYLQEWREGEKVGKIILLKDIHTVKTHAGHLRILKDLQKTSDVRNFAQLHSKWLKVLDTKELNKRFFQELANWYFWAVESVNFPDDEEKKRDVRNATNVIRLITRLMFVWFLKEKGLVSPKLFDRVALDRILKFEDESSYYKAILQNLFFATLNSDMGKRKFIANESGRSNQHFVHNVFRYKREFNTPEQTLEELFEPIPFLNGGLFECLDKEIETEDGKSVRVRVDGFSDNAKNVISVPDELFFGQEEEIDLNDIYGTKNKRYKVRGLINILESYKFTIAENTPLEEEIALDPELLGKVFENLLASYNPETQTTARKQTGSFYTPREIVNYMVDESLIAYLKQKLNEEMTGFGFVAVGEDQATMFGNEGRIQQKFEMPISHNRYVGKEEDAEAELRNLFDYADDTNHFNETETEIIIQGIDECKILDPACGSGAFPMGILHRLVHLLSKLDPNNEKWREWHKQKAIKETEKAFEIGDVKEREERLKEINQIFEDNSNDYGRKLFLIENCIYGVDIQPIAIQIAKLRFFISLVVEQKPNKDKENLGIRPLPNLETKFVAADTLIGLDNPHKKQSFFETNEIKDLEGQLKHVRSRSFAARYRSEKVKLRKKDTDLRNRIATLVEADLNATLDSIVSNDKLNREILFCNQQGDFDRSRALSSVLEKKYASLRTKNHETAQLLAKWNPYDQNASADWFDSEYMFGIRDGFSVILGNPPYIQMQKDGGYLSKKYVSQNYDTFARTGDIYSLFYEKGYKLLKSKGVLCFITSNKWMRAGYGESTRSFFLKNTNPLMLIDFAGQRIFDAATVDTNILLFAKDKNRHQTRACVVKENVLNNLSVYFKQNASRSSFKSNQSWVVLSPIEQRIRAKIEAAGTPLKDWDIKIYRGILTGFNEAFVINGEKKDELIAADPKSAEIIRPILRGRDIKRYIYDFADRWLICATRDIVNTDIPHNYPAICKHLEKYKGEGKLGDNSTTNVFRRPWWSLMQEPTGYWDEFSKQKIVWKRVGSILRFSYDKLGMMALDSTCFATGKYIKFLVAVLNSKMGHYLMKDAPQTGTGDLLISVQAIEPLKIPIPNLGTEELVEKIIDKILKRPNDLLEKQLDQIIYKLYELDKREIMFIESQ